MHEDPLFVNARYGDRGVTPSFQFEFECPKPFELSQNLISKYGQTAAELLAKACAISCNTTSDIGNHNEFDNSVGSKYAKGYCVQNGPMQMGCVVSILSFSILLTAAIVQHCAARSRAAANDRSIQTGLLDANGDAARVTFPGSSRQQSDAQPAAAAAAAAPVATPYGT